MNKLMKYETPEIEVTRFNIQKSVMADLTDFFGPSQPDGGPTKPTIDWDAQKGAQKHEKEN